jgi:uncharacterized integral membrane protein
MLRLIKALVVAGLLGVFGYQNWDDVTVLFFLGPPTRVRLIFLLAIAAGVGYVVALITNARHEVRLMRENRQLRDQLRPFLAAPKGEVATALSVRPSENYQLEPTE